MKRKYPNRLGSNEKEILKLIGGGVLITVGILATIALPGLPATLSPFLKNRQKRSSFKKSIKRLKEKNLVYLSCDKVKISKIGMEMLEYLKADEITIKKTKWDGNRRLVAYDIPEKFRKKRDYLRLKLIDLGFKKVQESIWTIPYECKEEIAIFSQSLGLSPFVIYMKTDSLPKHKELKKYFGLK